jgi:hypothetical protein
MKNLSLFLMMSVIALTACSDPQYPSGRFFNAFSLDETIKRLNMPELKHSGASSSYTSSAGDPTPYRKAFALELRIEDQRGSRFDEKVFLQKLNTAIKQEAQNSNVNVTGGGEAVGESFHVNYQDGGNQGAVEVVGVRVENDRYKIWCVVRELGVPNKN